jgi:hypothetical protein
VEARADPKDGCLRGLVDGPPGGPPVLRVPAMARRRQSSGSFNLSGFDAVDVGVDLGAAIDVLRVLWKPARIPRTAAFAVSSTAHPAARRYFAHPTVAASPPWHADGNPPAAST